MFSQKVLFIEFFIIIIIVIFLNEHLVNSKALLSLLYTSTFFWKFRIESKSPGTNMICPSLSNQLLLHCELWNVAWCSWSWLFFFFFYICQVFSTEGEDPEYMCITYHRKSWVSFQSLEICWIPLLAMQKLSMPWEQGPCVSCLALFLWYMAGLEWVCIGWMED